MLLTPTPPELDPLGLDTETYYCKKTYSVQDLGPWHYARDPRFDCYMLSVSDGKSNWAGHPSEFNYDATKGRILVTQNRAFDEEVLAAMAEKGLCPKLEYKEWHCTGNMSAYLWNVRSLADACQVGLGITIDKGTRDKADGKQWKDMVAEGWGGEMLQYAGLDPQYAVQLWNEHGHKWPEHERRLSDLTINQGRRGVAIDIPRLEQGIVALQRVIIVATQNLPWVARGRKLGSSIGVAEECRTAGIPCQPVKERFPEEHDEWLEKYSIRFPWVAALKNLRKAQKMLATLETIKQRLRPDGTAFFMLKYFGAHCMPGDHEVLSPTGWVRLDEWNGGAIAQLADGKTCFAEATANKFEGVTERLMTCRSGQVDFSVTEGHHIATVNKRKELVLRQAGELFQKGFHLPVSAPRAKWHPSAPEQHDRLRLRIAIQADGHYQSDCRSIRFRLTRPRKIKRLLALLKSTGVVYRRACYPSEPTVTVVTLPSYPQWLEGAKQFGPEIIRYSPTELNAFVEELVHWDGTQSGTKSFTYVTTSKNNAEWVQTAAHLAGRAALVTVKPRQNNWSTAYLVSVRQRRTSRLHKKHWSVSDAAAGTVFCPTTAHGVFLVRHNGCICFTGNTGRWSGDGGWNLQNPNKVPLFIGHDDLFILDIKRLSECADLFAEEKPLPTYVKDYIDLRGLIIARPGKMLCPCDLSQIEPRVLNWLAGNDDFLAAVGAGQSPYEVHARLRMGWTGGKLKSENPKKYGVAKVRLIQLGYQSGWKKFMSYSLSQGVDICEGDEEAALRFSADGIVYTDDQGTRFVKVKNPYYNPEKPGSREFRKYEVEGCNSREQVNDFRAKETKITALWKKLQDDIEAAIGGDLILDLPSGRQLRYLDVKFERRKVKDEETGDEYNRKVLTCRIGTKRKIIYGGLICENLCQAIARDVFAGGMLNMVDAGLDVLFHAHDEAVPEVDPATNVKDVEALLTVPPSWLPGCPLGAEAILTPRYKK